MRRRIAGVSVGVLFAVFFALAGCVHTELVWRDFEDERLYIDVRIEPDAEIDASYFLKLDPDDPVGTIVSIGSSVAKAAQVENAQDRMDAVMRRIDLDRVVRAEVARHFEEVEEMRIVNRENGADYVLEIVIWRYGIRANDELGGTFFEVHSHATLKDISTDTMVWDDFSMVERRIGPEVFGIPSADNLLSAAMLAGLSEEEMGAGVTRVTREVARAIGEQFRRDLRVARNRR